MMDVNPRAWRSTRMVRGFTYSMRYDPDKTLDKLQGIKYRVVDRRFYNQPSMWNAKLVWGWMKLREPLQLWDAMEAGLVPMFNTTTR